MGTARSPPVTRREVSPNLSLLTSKYAETRTALTEVLQIDPLQCEWEELSSLIPQVKSVWREFLNDSTALIERYTKIASFQESQEVRRERTEMRTEVRQLIDLANGILKKLNLDLFSNIDTLSNRAPSISGEMETSLPNDSTQADPNTMIHEYESSPLDSPQATGVRPKTTVATLKIPFSIPSEPVCNDTKIQTEAAATLGNQMPNQATQPNLTSQTNSNTTRTQNLTTVTSCHQLPIQTVHDNYTSRTEGGAAFYLVKHELFRDSNNPFDGEPYKYKSWVLLLQSRMSGVDLSPLEVISVLTANTTGEPKRLVQDYLAVGAASPSLTLEKIWEALEKQFGSPVKVSSAMQKKLSSIPPIRPPNINSKLKDLIHVCNLIDTNMNTNPELQLFNLSMGQKQIWSKLPDWLQKKWRSRGHQYSRGNLGALPQFSMLIDFLESSFEEMTDPNYELTTEANSVRKTLASATVERGGAPESVACLYHGTPGHLLVNCRSFLRLSGSEKQRFASDKRLCFRCLGDHMARDCKGNLECAKCKGNHVTLMHMERKPYGNKDETQSSTTTRNYNRESNNALCSVMCGNPERALSCSKTVLCELHHESNPNKTMRVYAILDDMSDSSYVSERVVDELQLIGRDETYVLNSLGSCRSVHQGLVLSGLWIRGVQKDKYFQLPELFTSSFIPGSIYEVGTPEMVKSIDHISHYADKFINLDKRAKPHILIGRDAGDLMKSTCFGDHAPFVCETPLGFTLIGSPCLDKIPKTKVKTVLKTSHDHYSSKILIPKNSFPCNDIFKEFKDDDELAPSRDDLRFLSIVNKTIHVNDKGSITMNLPFRSDNPKMPDNKQPVFMRTRSTLDKLKTQPKKLTQCLEAMGKNIMAGHVEECPSFEPQQHQLGKSWFLPIFAVTQKKKDKTRLVFDSSAKYRGVSLNSALLQGPDENNRLRGVMMRFRMGEVAFGGDVESMFYNFYLPDEDKNFLKFFWFKANDPSKELTQYRGCVHLFGNTCSPALAHAGLKFATSHHPEAHHCPDAVKFLSENMYVDDLLAACRSREDAVKYLAQITTILSYYKIRFCKLISNSSEVLKHFPESERASKTEELIIGDASTHRALGLAWQLKSDNLFIKVELPEKPFTRRGILAVSNSIYDPLGMVGPVVLQARLIQRKALKRSDNSVPIDWDTPLSEEFVKEWRDWLSSLSGLDKITLSRSYIPPSFDETLHFELHTFADASEVAIGAVVYVKVIDSSNRVNVSLVLSASKLVPKSCISMPRSELCAALLGSKILTEVKKELSLEFDVSRIYCDSAVVLAYIHNTNKRFTKYVSNRVHSILKLTDPKQWTYINSSQNPADIASRPQSVNALTDSVWLRGPNFLWLESQDGKEDFSHQPPRILPEELPERTSAKTARLNNCSLGEICDRMSSLSRALGVVLSVLRFIIILLERRGIATTLTPQSDVALRILIRQAQYAEYHDLIEALTNKRSISNHRLSSLDPFIDENGVLGVGGRLRDSLLDRGMKHPVIIPPTHSLSTLIVRKYHSDVHHQGRHLTLGAIRSAGFFISKGSKLMRQFIANCVTCRRLRGLPAEQMMSPLPPSRVEDIAPFLSTGTDVFGPYLISESRSTRQSKGSKKIWGVLFTCMASRAIHIEPLYGMDTSSLANALRRFINTRGNCKHFYSDQGTNFVGINNQTDASFESVRVELRKRDCTWSFIPPHSSHFGGAWERKVGAIKRVLDGAMAQLRGRTLNTDELTTLFSEAMAVVNNTPMWEVSSDPKDPIPLSPSMILTLKSSASPPPLEKLTPSDLLSYGPKRWHRVQYLAECFWQKWRLYFILGLQERSKWTKKQRNISAGDVVLLKNKCEKRNNWPIGIVRSVKKSRDDLVRSVSVETKSGQSTTLLDRPITELVLLVESK